MSPGLCPPDAGAPVADAMVVAVEPDAVVCVVGVVVGVVVGGDFCALMSLDGNTMDSIDIDTPARQFTLPPPTAYQWVPMT